MTVPSFLAPEQVEAFRTRALDSGPYTFVWGQTKYGRKGQSRR
ncbi:hypothetical protein ABZV14_35865 [Streptosporangium canum]